MKGKSRVYFSMVQCHDCKDMFEITLIDRRNDGKEYQVEPTRAIVRGQDNILRHRCGGMVSLVGHQHLLIKETPTGIKEIRLSEGA